MTYWLAEGAEPENLAYLKTISQIHEVAFRRLLSGGKPLLPEVAELCEDIGNLYLTVADDIRAVLIAGLEHSGPITVPPQSARPCPPE